MYMVVVTKASKVVKKTEFGANIGRVAHETTSFMRHTMSNLSKSWH